MFGCISCHIANYIRSVDVFNEELQAKLEEKFDDPIVFATLLREAYYNIMVQNVQRKVYVNVDKDGTGQKQYYICKTCKTAFLANKLPRPSTVDIKISFSIKTVFEVCQENSFKETHNRVAVCLLQM